MEDGDQFSFDFDPQGSADWTSMDPRQLEEFAERITAEFLATDQGKMLIKIAKGYRAIDPSMNFLAFPTAEQLAEQATEHLISIGVLRDPRADGAYTSKSAGGD